MKIIGLFIGLFLIIGNAYAIESIKSPSPCNGFINNVIDNKKTVSIYMNARSNNSRKYYNVILTKCDDIWLEANNNKLIKIDNIDLIFFR